MQLDLPFAPTMDIGIEHAVWHEPRRPVSVSYSVEDDRFFVHLGFDRLTSKEARQTHAEMYRAHGWEVTD